MAAATEAEKYGLAVIVLGEQQRPGGQVYRTIEQIGPDVMNILGPDYREGENLVRRFRETPIDYLPGATVWQVESGSEITVGETRKVLELGALGPNQLKSQTRCGMGPGRGPFRIAFET